MPDPWERHGRPGRWDWWDNNSSRSQQRAAAANDDPVTPVRKARRNRDPDRCTGSPDRQHHGELVLRPVFNVKGVRKACRWEPAWYRKDPGDPLAVWLCVHQEICTGCGKLLWSQISGFPGEARRRCPDFPGDEEQKAAAEQVTLAREATRASSPRWYQRKPPPSGRQSYRKPKGK